MAVSPILRAALAAGRPRLNALVAEARHRQSGFDGESLGSFVLAALDPIAQSVGAAAPHAVDSVVGTAFEIAVGLVAQNLAGPASRTPVVNRVWAELGPALARFVAAEPAAVLAAITNAAVNLSKVDTARPDFWVDQMIAHSQSLANIDELFALGQVLAWRSGMAHYRAGAIGAASTLSPPLALASVGADPGLNWDDVRARLQADRWWSPDSRFAARSATGISIGAFTGFGGIFPVPPQIRAAAEGFWVQSGDRHAYLLADAHGAVLIAATRNEFEQAPADLGEKSPPPLPTAAGLLANGRTIPIEFPLQGLQIARNPDSLAIASPFSYTIRVVPRS